MGFGLEGPRVRLVPLDFDRHFENCLRWINDREVTAWLGMHDVLMSRMAEREWFDKIAARFGTDHFFWAIETLDGVHIGNSSADRIMGHDCYQTGTLLGDRTYWGQGLGTEANFLRLQYLFEDVGAWQLQSGYLDGNVASARMQERLGFEIAGRFPQQFWRRGAYRDHILTVMTRSRYESLRDEGFFRLIESKTAK